MRSTPAAEGWMPSRWLSLSVAGDAIEKERVEQRVILGRKFRIDGFEALAEILAKVRRCPHSCKQHRDPPLVEPSQDGVERGSGLGRVEPAQHVVGAERNDDAVGAVRHRPVETGKPVGGGVAGDTGVRRSWRQCPWL